MDIDPRRSSPRIGLEALAWEVLGEHERSSLVVDLSTQGARLERPYLPAGYVDYDGLELGPAGASRYVAPPIARRYDRVPMQLEVPGLDEVLWASGDVVFDELVQTKTNGGPFGFVRRTGVHIALAAKRDLDLLSDYVWEMHTRAQRAARLSREMYCDSLSDMCAG